jgi:hypothetical protein
VPNITMIKVLINGRQLIVRGRVAWALASLIAAGEDGCTYLDYPAPRWSDYVHRIRELGFVIDTLRVNHGGVYPGYHARYVLRSKVHITETLGAAP